MCWGEGMALAPEQLLGGLWDKFGDGECFFEYLTFFQFLKVADDF